MLSGGVVSGGGCMHDMNPDRREKQDGSLPSDPGLRSPGSSSTAALSLVEFRPSGKSASSGQTEFKYSYLSGIDTYPVGRLRFYSTLVRYTKNTRQKANSIYSRNNENQPSDKNMVLNPL
ncbi:hypothetical protein AVEN_161003-1 [Araneus ventricosus]|uniref:Uncharacterized protein n=1 Tax=Araneus ventricosus TaxID=182803 RepID=A0A4Y2G169_ARAVE|nr:hypothetical protein AVEN_161003-1 [Araneus ventricosus]